MTGETIAPIAPLAVTADALGPVGNYALRPMARRPLADRQVRIAVRAAGVSFVDVLVSEGRYQALPKLPFTPGSECAGIVSAIGPCVDHVGVGQRVVASGWAGMFAEEATVAADAVWPMPEPLSFAEGATLLVSYSTAWHALADRGRIEAGDTLLVLGAGGAVGYAAIQIARHLGAHVIASASSDAKRALAVSAGAHAAVDSRAPDWREQVAAANHGKPIDLVLDPVGGLETERGFRTLGWNGRHLVVGFPAGIASLPANLALLKSASLVGVNLSQLSVANPEHARRNVETLLLLAAAGVLRPAIARTFALTEFAEAMRAASEGSQAGRIAITMG